MVNMSPYWKPKRTLAECNAIMDAPGSPWETEVLQIKGRKFKSYVNVPKSAREFWLASKQFGDKDYIIFENERYTYNQMHAKVNALAHLFRQRGVVKGSRVALCMRNFPEWVAVFWAAELLGAVIVCVNAWNPAEIVTKLLIKTTPVMLVVDDERAVQLVPGVSLIRDAGCKTLLVARAGDKHIPGFESFDEALKPHLAESAGVPEVDGGIHPEDPCAIFFTSGTTSIPKGVLATQRQTLQNVLTVAVGSVRSILRRGEDLPAPDPNQLQRSLLLGVPLFHVTGCHSFLFIATSMGGKMILMRKWDLKEAIRIIKTEKVTSTGGIPYLVMELMRELANDPTHTVEGFSFGGAPAPPSLANSFKSMRAEMTAAQGYGATETCGVCAAHVDEDYIARPGSTGLATLINEIKICHVETEEPLTSNNTGEVWIKGGNIAEGYYLEPEKTAEVFTADGWYKTGDLGYLDEEGFLYITGRAKEIIIRGGENISSVQVESVLYEHPSVQEVAVVPVPDKSLGELVSAAIYLKPEWAGKVTPEELINHVAGKLPRHCVPVLIHLRSEMLERNAAGKVLKNIHKDEMTKLWEARAQATAKL